MVYHAQNGLAKGRCNMMGLGLGIGLTRGGVASRFAPAAIEGLERWYDPSVAASVTSSGGSISDIADLKGTNDLSQPTSGKRPTETTINSLGAMSFNEPSEQHLYGAGWVPSFNDGPFTAFAVMQFGPGPFATHVALSFSSASNSDQAHNILAYNGEWYAYRRDDTRAFDETITSSGDPISANTPYIGAHIFNGTTGEVRINKSQVATGNMDTNTATFNRFVIGAFKPELLNYVEWAGKIGEVLIYNRALTAGEVSQVEDYLSAKWTT